MREDPEATDARALFCGARSSHTLVCPSYGLSLGLLDEVIIVPSGMSLAIRLIPAARTAAAFGKAVNARPAVRVHRCEGEGEKRYFHQRFHRMVTADGPTDTDARRERDISCPIPWRRAAIR